MSVNIHTCQHIYTHLYIVTTHLHSYIDNRYSDELKDLLCVSRNTLFKYLQNIKNNKPVRKTGGRPIYLTEKEQTFLADRPVLDYACALQSMVNLKADREHRESPHVSKSYVSKFKQKHGIKTLGSTVQVCTS